MRRSTLTSLIALAVLAVPAQAVQQPDITPPPKPVENFVPVTEAEVLKALPARERQIIDQRTDPRERFDALVDVSDLRLADIGAKLDAGAHNVTAELLLYESVVRVADQLLRKPSSSIPARDKRFKKFERRLSRQLTLLHALLPELGSDDGPTGAAVVTTVTRIRSAALESALDANVLEEP